MCRATNERGGPRRCSGDSRAAAAAATAKVAQLTGARHEIADQLCEAIPAEPTVQDMIALHPEQQTLIRELHNAGLPVMLSKDLRDESGRPLLLTQRRLPTGVDQTTVSVASQELPTLIDNAYKSWESFKISYHAADDGSSVASIRSQLTFEDDEVPEKPFVAPAKMTEMVAAALAAQRPLVVQHFSSSDGSSFVLVKAQWTPEGSDVPTEVRIHWCPDKSGALRQRSAMASGRYRGTHNISGKRALALLEGRECFSRE